MSDEFEQVGPTREELRPSQIQYQLLQAQLAIGDTFDGPEDAPAGVLEALEHIKTAMNLVADPEAPLSECRPAAAELTDPDHVHSELTDQDWDALAESTFVDVARAELTDEPAFVFDHPGIGLHGFRWREASRTLESVTYNEIGGGTDDGE